MPGNIGPESKPIMILKWVHMGNYTPPPQIPYIFRLLRSFFMVGNERVVTTAHRTFFILISFYVHPRHALYN